MALKEAVTQAISEIRKRFDGHEVEVAEDGEGGAYVTVKDLEVGPLYVQRTTWLGAQIVCTYPYADVYPHFCRGDLTRVDRRELGEGTSRTTWRERSAVQLSRRSNQLNAEIDRADLKFLKVLEWLRTHP